MDGAFLTSFAQGGFFNGWEVLLILAVLLILIAGRNLPDLISGFLERIDDRKKANREILDIVRRALESETQRRDFKFRLRDFGVALLKQIHSGSTLWTAQGFGVGRITIAPGTFGSLAGLVWFALLLASRRFEFYLLGALLGIALSVWLCGEAEKILKQTDPGSIVLDEIVAMPICFASWVGVFCFQHGQLPMPEYFISSHTWPWTVGVFAAFRFFDVVKPWPVRQSQSLPGGWGVTVDDLLAAVYVNLLSLVVLGIGSLAHRPQ